MPRKRKTVAKQPVARVAIEVEAREDFDKDRFAFALLQYARLISKGDEESPIP
jgi:hypothetical protein